MATKEYEAMSLEDQLQVIVRYVANAFHMDLERLAAYRNDKEATIARDVGIWIAHKATTAEALQIVRAFCRRDQGVLTSALNRVEDRRYNDIDFKRRVDDIRDEVLAAFALDGGFVLPKRANKPAPIQVEADHVNWGFTRVTQTCGRQDLEIQNRRFAAAMIAAGYRPTAVLGA